LANLNFADDNEIDAKCPENFKRYCEIADESFLQFYDNHIFYLARKMTVEGETNYSLIRLNPDGTNRELILQIKSSPYLLTITKGYVFYVDSFTEDVFVANLNTSDTQKITFPKNHKFITFKFSEEYLYLQTYDEANKTHHFYNYNFLTNEPTFIFSKDIQIIDGDRNNLLIYDIISWDPLLAEMKVVNQNMELVVELVDENRHLNYLDSDFIYTSSLQGPQRYVIYDYLGNIVYDIDALEGLKVSDFIRGVYSSMEASQIQGIISNYLFVVGGADDGIKYYLVDYKTGDWIEVFKSVSGIIDNG